MSLRRFVGFIHPRIAVVLHDLVMTALAWWIAKMLRYALKPDEVVHFSALGFPIVLLVQGMVFRWTGLYRSVWRFASLPDLWNIVRAVAPISRSCSHRLMMLLEETVVWSSSVGSYGAVSTRTLSQSVSNSSATSIARLVRTP